VKRVLLIVVALALLAAPAFAAGKSARPAAPAHRAGSALNGDRTAERLAKMLGERYGVQVLSAHRVEAGGKPAYSMVVMKAGGNFNDAFAVHTLVVDAKTGDLVPQFQNTESGYQLSTPPDRSPRDDALGTTIRRESFMNLR
jgi:hypothetical protein